MAQLSAQLEGKRFGELTVRRSVPRAECGRYAMWLCICDCGTEKMVRSDMLVSGKTTTCGCKLRRPKTHGESYSPEYRTYCQMIRRVLNPSKERDARNYRDRGIVVCDRWRHGDAKKSGFECFLSDMGRKPTPAHSLDRIDNDGNYEPSNCRWATPKEQSLNQRKTLFVEYRGETYTLQDAANSFASISYSGVYQRIRSGWTIADAIDTPSVGNKK